jgi:RNA polymerase sigma-70 factor (ECF subfamily)
MEPVAREQMSALYYPLVYGWCLRAGLQPNDAVDVAQEVFQAVASAISGFVRQGEGSFRGWIAGITRHKLQDHWRGQGKEPRGEGGTAAQQRLAELPDPNGLATADSTPTGGLTRLVRNAAEARAEFEDRTWRAFWCCTVDGRMPADVAAELGMSVNSVYLAKSRVLRRMRELLGELDP